MPDIVTRHFKTLTDFNGRETRGEFWPYAGLVFLASCVAMVIIGIAFIFIANDPFQSDFAWVAALSIVVIVLLAAAVVRRLHDRGLGGAWGLLPLPFLALAFFEMHREFLAFEAQEPDSAFNTAFASGALYDISLIVLIVLLAGRSDEDANRFGPSSRDVR